MGMAPPRCRECTFAGSWYKGEQELALAHAGDELAEQLDGFLEQVGGKRGQHPRAIIAPHAGYHFSGKCAAHSYKRVDASRVDRIILMGPSHRVYMDRAALPQSSVSEYNTPLGPLPLDTSTLDELRRSGRFKALDMATDEAEHSLELHLPYLRHVLGGSSARLVPIMVGALSEEEERQVGRLLEPYLRDERTLFVVSSDFCHWGRRFGFFFHDPSRYGTIQESIAALDRLGMDIIEDQDPDAFASYLRRYSNTICGRHPIAVLLHSLNCSSEQFSVTFLNYDRSCLARSFDDSSVSYASAVVTPLPAATSAGNG